MKCNTSNTEKLFNLIVDSAANYDDVLIFGDLNINILNGMNGLGVLNDHFKLVNHFCPTHSWPGAVPTLIDIVLARKVNNVGLMSHYNLIPATHHDLILISYGARFHNNGNPSSFEYRNYEKIETNELINGAEDLD